LRRKLSRLILAPTLALALVAGACGGGDDGGESTASTVDTKDQKRGGTVTLAAEQEPTALNWLTAADNAAWTQYVMQFVWQGATWVGPKGEFHMNEYLLDSMELTEEDPQTVVYKIKEDAVWDDGKPVSADDFIFTWTAQNGKEKSGEKDPETGEDLPKYSAASTTGYEDIKSVVGSDNGKTVTVTFAKPFADWESLFDYVLPRHGFEAAGGGDLAKGFNEGFQVASVDLKNVLSSGPYDVSEYKPGESMTLVRNEKFYGDEEHEGFADRIVIPFITDATQQPGAMSNGEIDVMFPQAQLDLVQQVQQITGVESEVGFGTFWEHLDFNFNNEFLKDKAVREAIALGLNRKDIVTRLPGAFSSEAKVLDNRIYFPGSDNYEPHGADKYGKLDVAAAKKKLQGAGYTLGSDGIFTKGGKQLKVRITWRDPNPRREQTAQLVQQQLKQVGILIELAPQPNFNFLDEGNFDIALFGWTGGTELSANTSIYVPDGGQNFGDYKNPKVQELFDEANIDLDAKSRAKTMNEIDEILWEDMATLPLFQVPEFLAWRDVVIGPVYNGYQGPTWNMNRWSLK
jgi:peptide/nickel transport system substrate-binding protein